MANGALESFESLISNVLTHFEKYALILDLNNQTPLNEIIFSNEFRLHFKFNAISRVTHKKTHNLKLLTNIIINGIALINQFRSLDSVFIRIVTK